MLRQIALTAGTRAGVAAFGVATSIVTARFLGQAGRGEYYFMVTLAALVTQFASLGITSSNTFFAARDPRRTPQLVANSAWIALTAAGGLGVGVALFAHAIGMLQDTPSSYLWLAAGLAPPTLLYAFLTSILVGRGQLRAFNGLEALLRIVLLPALVAAGLLGAGAPAFVAVSIVVWLLGAGVAIVLIARHARVTLRPDRELLVAGFRYATKAYAVTLLAFVVLRGNVFLLRREFGPADLGLFSIAAQVADVLAIAPQAAATVLLPHLVRDAEERWRRTVRVTLWIAAVMVVVCLTAAIAARPMLRLLYGAEFEPSARVLHIMLPSVFALAVAGVLSQYLAAIGLPRPLLAVWGGGVVVMAAASLLLIPSRGAAGAAAALSLAHLATLAGVVVVAYAYRQAPPRGPQALSPSDPAP